MENLTIRLETEKDYRAVEELTREAFWNVYKPGADEHYFVRMMRNHPDFIPELAFVLEKDGVVYAGSRHGVVTAVDPAAQKVMWSLPLGSSEVNGIDVDATPGDLYVSLIEGTIFRIKKN